MNPKRVRTLNKNHNKNGPVAYWMSRDQRAYDNWSLNYSIELANKSRVSLLVLFCVVPEFLSATMCQYDFMLKGLEETEKQLKKSGIPLLVLMGKPENLIPEFIEKNNIGVLVTDFDPLKIKGKWKENITSKIDIDFYEVDSHNIVPCWIASNKQEYGAYTIRPKIKKLLGEFLEDFPKYAKVGENKNKKITSILKRKTNWVNIKNSLRLNNSKLKLNWIKPGYKNAVNMLDNFITDKIFKYNDQRNDPNKDVQSDLSPYLHFGQISAQRIVLEISKLDIKDDLKKSFLEELVIRRELADNYCFYNNNYDSFDGFPDWSKNTLNDHRHDRRPYIYSIKQLENARTHDDLWNASQIEMVKTGKMHGYMRMYWSKKILEWTKHPEEAFEYALYLNDRYELDGRDPNGYTGIAWSIGGVHDRAWKERDVFGKVRYMSYEGCKRKFDIKSYIKKVNNY